MASYEDSVRWIQRWPGSLALEKRVPSIITYDRWQPRQVTGWGYLSEDPPYIDDNTTYVEWFRNYLDPALLRGRTPAELIPPLTTQEGVERYCEDYLRCLYCHIESQLSNDLTKPWATTAVQFLFSVPFQWGPDTIKIFRNTLVKAGFGSSPSHTLGVGVTEAEAIAFHAYNRFPEFKVEALGQVVLVVNTGESSSYGCLLRVFDDNREFVRLQHIHGVGGELGMLTIDTSFEALVYQRLKLAVGGPTSHGNYEDIAWQMARSTEFRIQKLAYDCEEGKDTTFFAVPLPGTSIYKEHEACGIANGEMRFAKEDLRKTFDLEVEKLLELLRFQLHAMEKSSPYSVVQILLDGEFGTIPYVVRKIKSAFVGYQIQVRVCPDPILAVACGLVEQRQWGLRSSGV